MTYISSDTNVWIDFSIIDRLDIPFSLPYTYLMSALAVEDELLSPAGIKDQLKKFGLQETELTEAELILTIQLNGKYNRLSVYDAMALAIAKERNIPLLSGDGALRRAAEQEGVSLMGTLRILDEAMSSGRIQREEYIEALQKLKENNGKQIRLPAAELDRRMEKACNEESLAEDERDVLAYQRAKEAYLTDPKTYSLDEVEKELDIVLPVSAKR